MAASSSQDDSAAVAQSKAHQEWEDGQTRMFSKMIGLMLNRPNIDARTDLKNGDILIKLVEKLSGRTVDVPLASENESRMKCLGRLNNLIEFLTSEKIHVTASAQNIYEVDIKLTLGLVWSLIYHYQISNKKSILEWVNGLAKELGFSVVNFTSSWTDGRALSVIVLALARQMECNEHGMAWGPALLAMSNTDRIFKALELSTQLGIPPLLEVSDVDCPRPDERIILTFVSYFYNSFIHGITLKPAKLPEPEPVPIIVDDSELIALRAQVKKLKAKLSSQKKEHKILIQRVEDDLGDLKLCYDSLERKFQSTLAQLKDSELKLGELNKKFALSKNAGGGREGPPPMENVTLVRCGVAGNTRIWKASPDAMFAAASVFNSAVRGRLSALNGYEIKYEAENFTIAFEDAATAVRFGLALQTELSEKDWSPELSALPESALVLDDEGNTLFCGLRAAISMVTGDPFCERDPSTGRYAYSGPVFNALVSISGLCQGGQILVDKDTHDRLKNNLAAIGSPDVKSLGEVSFSDLPDNLFLYQMLPPYLAGRQFKPLASPEKLTAVMVGLEIELTSLESENIALRDALSKLHAQSQEGQSKVSAFSSWLRTTARGKTAPNDKKSQLDREIQQLLAGQETLEKAVRMADDNTAELEQSIIVLRRNLALAEKATSTLTQRFDELAAIHARCGEYVPPEYLLYPGCPRENIIKAPREVIFLFEKHPDLRIKPDALQHGKWIIGCGSYTLRQIHKGDIDPSDLGKEGRRTVTVKPEAKRMKTRPKSLFFRRAITQPAVHAPAEPAASSSIDTSVSMTNLPSIEDSKPSKKSKKKGKDIRRSTSSHFDAQAEHK